MQTFFNFNNLAVLCTVLLVAVSATPLDRSPETFHAMMSKLKQRSLQPQPHLEVADEAWAHEPAEELLRASALSPSSEDATSVCVTGELICVCVFVCWYWSDAYGLLIGARRSQQ